MSTLKSTTSSALVAAMIVAGVTGLALPAAAQSAGDTRLGVGTAVKEADLGDYFSIPPDGRGLPTGHGSAREGAALFQERCAVCHGEKLQGDSSPGLGGDKLIGGRGSLATDKPVKTTESYWPYATTMFDYIKRAMPYTAPGSLTNDEVYSLVAYILSEGHVIPADQTLDASNLPKIQMPNRNGFIPDARPELSLYR
jgi:S-disulfanyl-L-cysteine oxidoreductase SoxD